MPRGNDSDAAAAELADRFKEGLGNAEELIIANNANYPVELIQASEKKIDEEATAEARENLDSYSGPDGEEAKDVAIRGGVAVVVYEDEAGRLLKAIVGDEDGQGSGPDAKKKSSSKKANTRAQSSKDEAKDE